MKIVRIEWFDAAAEEGWQEKASLKIGGDDACVTVGFLVIEDGNWVQIAHTDGDNQWHGVFDIPRGCITKMEVLREDAD